MKKLLVVLLFLLYSTVYAKSQYEQIISINPNQECMKTESEIQWTCPGGTNIYVLYKNALPNVTLNSVIVQDYGTFETPILPTNFGNSVLMQMSELQFNTVAEPCYTAAPATIIMSLMDQLGNILDIESTSMMAPTCYPQQL